jgi:AraC-like DNA-binding protein
MIGSPSDCLKFNRRKLLPDSLNTPMTTLDDLRQLSARLVGDKPEDTLCGVRIRRVDAPGAPMQHLAESAFGLILQGRKRTVGAGEVFDYGPGDCLVMTLSMPVAGNVTQASREEPYLGLAWALDPAAIARLVMEVEQPALAADVPAMAVHAAPGALLDAVYRLLALAEQPEDEPVMRPLLEKEILWRLLRSPCGPMLRQMSLADSRLSRVNRAIQWLRRHYTETVRTEQLEEVSGMSAASLFRHFKAFTSLSPLQYQKQIRLHEARTRLAAGARDVAQVAHQVGYESPSQFTREYARLFGHPPREDLRRPQGRAA